MTGYSGNKTALIVGCTLGGIFLAMALILAIFIHLYFSPEAKTCFRDRQREKEKSFEAIGMTNNDLPGISWSRVPTLKADRKVEKSHANVIPHLDTNQVEGPYRSNEKLVSASGKDLTPGSTGIQEGELINSAFEFLDEI